MTRRFKGKYANLSQRTLKNRELPRESLFVAVNVKNRDLSRRMGKIAIPHVPRFPFVLAMLRSSCSNT